MQMLRISIIMNRLRPKRDSSAQMMRSPGPMRRRSLPSSRLVYVLVPEMVSSIQPSMCRPSRQQKLLISKRWFSTVCRSLLTLMYPYVIFFFV